MSKYFKVTISAAGEDEQENLIGLLHYISEFESVNQLEDQVIVSYAADKQDRAELSQRLAEMNIREYQIEDEADVNWNETYEKSFQPIIIKDAGWCVRASFHEPLSVKNEIIIDPKMSFGTGHHETTYQMMEMIASLDLRNKKVWDYGSGTGILAIMAEKLGASEIIANDNEDWAYENSLENALINQCTRVKFGLGDIEASEKAGLLRSDEDFFDVIIANITKNILIESAFKISQYSNSGTILLLSGFYEKDIQEIAEHFHGFQFGLIFSTTRNEWACLKLLKK